MRFEHHSWRVAPLQYVGAHAYRKDYQEFLAQFDGPIDVEYRDPRIIANGDVAFIHALELIVHNHVSVPIDFDNGKALLDRSSPEQDGASAEWIPGPSFR